MAAPTYRGAGGTGNQSGTTSFTATAVTGNAENDILLIVMESSDSTTAAGTPTTPTDWTKIFEDTDGAGATNVTTLTIFARLAPAGGSGNVTVSGVGDHCCGRMFAVTAGTHGVSNVATDIVVGAAGKHGTGTTGLTTPGITVTADSLIFWCIGLSDDAADSTNASGYTNANLASITERTDSTVTAGAGGGIAVATATCAGTATGNGTWAHDTAVRSLSVYLSIPPLAGTIASGVGSADGAAVTDGSGASLAAAAGTSAGSGVAEAASAVLAGGAGNSASISDGQAVGASTASGDGLTEGNSSADAVGTEATAEAPGDGLAQGAATAEGEGVTITAAAGEAGGVSTSEAAGSMLSGGDGGSVCISIAESEGASIAEGAGFAEGVSTAEAVGDRIAVAAPAEIKTGAGGWTLAARRHKETHRQAVRRKRDEKDLMALVAIAMPIIKKHATKGGRNAVHPH